MLSKSGKVYGACFTCKHYSIAEDLSDELQAKNWGLCIFISSEFSSDLSSDEVVGSFSDGTVYVAPDFGCIEHVPVHDVA